MISLWFSPSNCIQLSFSPPPDGAPVIPSPQGLASWRPCGRPTWCGSTSRCRTSWRNGASRERKSWCWRSQAGEGWSGWMTRMIFLAVKGEAVPWDFVVTTPCRWGERTKGTVWRGCQVSSLGVGWWYLERFVCTTDHPDTQRCNTKT